MQEISPLIFNYLGIVGTIGSYTVTVYMIQRQIRKKQFKLIKENGYDNWLIGAHSLEDGHSIKELEEKIDYKSISDLVPYIEKIKNFTSPENMKTAYRNLTTVVLKRKITDIITLSNGFYYCEENKINYVFKNAIGHELLHMASTFYDEKNDVIYCGFSQENKERTIGDGLNEGYTALLEARIFNKNHKVKTYKNLVNIARLFEFFFDDSKDMERYYFNHDLPGFIRHVSQFAPKHEVIEILGAMDILLKTHMLDNLPSYDEIKIKMKLYEIFKSNCKDKSKLAAFERELKKDPFIALTFKRKNFKLKKDNINMNIDRKPNP